MVRLTHMFATSSSILKHSEAFWGEISVENLCVELSELFNGGLGFVGNCLENTQNNEFWVSTIPENTISQVLTTESSPHQRLSAHHSQVNVSKKLARASARHSHVLSTLKELGYQLRKPNKLG